ncbi:MAG: hypothetical protein IT289_11390 [Oligoflexia bacterium]|nr:hypothetical protein [Oligoflexia bacterium]
MNPEVKLARDQKGFWVMVPGKAVERLKTQVTPDVFLKLLGVQNSANSNIEEIFSSKDLKNLKSIGVLIDSKEVESRPRFKLSLDWFMGLKIHDLQLPDGPFILNPSLRPIQKNCILTDPMTGLQISVEMSHDSRAQIQSLKKPLKDLKTNHEYLFHSRVLVPKAWVSAKYRRTLIVSWRKELRKKRYLKIPWALPRIVASSYSKYLSERITRGLAVYGDDMVAHRFWEHTETEANRLHQGLCKFTSQVFGRPLKASYNYWVRYANLAVLRRHLDRRQCRFSSSVMLDQSFRKPSEQSAQNWPLIMGEERIILTPGQGVFYFGEEVEHEREQMPTGMEYTSLLLHYLEKKSSEVLR